MKGDALTQEIVKQLFNYDPDTGILTNKFLRGSRGLPGAEAGANCKTWHGKTYKHVSIDRKMFAAHRVIWLYMTGEMPVCIDHIDGNGLNNRFSNLRSVTRRENAMNVRLTAKNTSGHVGVYWHALTKKWTARIWSRKQGQYLGLYDNIEDAIAARKAAEISLGFHPNHGQQRPL